MANPRTQADPWEQFGLFADRPSPVGRGIQEGFRYYATDAGVEYVVVAGAWKAISAPGMVGFIVGPAGSGAPYLTFTSAIAAAVAAGAKSVSFLAGAYVESFSVPANMSILPLETDSFGAGITGEITLTGLTGIQSLRGFSLTGRILAVASAASTASVGLIELRVVTTAAGNNALYQGNDGWTFRLIDSTFDATATAAPAFNTDGSASLDVSGCQFRSDATHEVVKFNRAGSALFKTCEFVGKAIRLPNGFNVTLNITDGNFSLPAASPTVIDGAANAGNAVNLHGTLRIDSLDAAGTILSAGTLRADPGINLGNLQVLNLPAAIGNGVSATCTDLTNPPNIAPVYYGDAAWRRYSDDSVAA